jgi:hypothetical protein
MKADIERQLEPFIGRPNNEETREEIKAAIINYLTNEEETK